MSDGEVRRFATTGGELAYTDTGDGPAVVLLHGFPLSSVTWRSLAPALTQRFRVVVPDLLGYGGSDRPAHAPLDLRAQAGYVRELLGHLGLDRVALVGHAHGGGIAQLLALDGLDVGAMVLLSSVASDAWPEDATRELQAVDPGSLDDEAVEARVRAALLTGASDPLALSDDVVSSYVAPWGAEGGAAAFLRAARALDGRGLTGHEAAFAAWGFPILLLWGEDDPVVPLDVAERLHDALPSSSLGLLPGVGHFVMDEAGPTVVPMVAEWLRAKYLGAPHTHGDVHAGVVMLQLERRSAVEDLLEYERDDPPVRYDPREQEVGPGA
ncbi:MAG TPA: alpha/beta hydrolase [Actinomycetota bacterium]|nr:alpha/beta hydrolase [Actinomycetota bacterium]